jgi:hypothetical protein
LQIQAIPGLNLSRAHAKMCSNELNTTGFLGLILHVGTCDFDDGLSPLEIREKMAACLVYLQHAHPRTKLAVALILPRPQDNSVAKEKQRKITNSQLKRLCKEKGVLFANSIDVVRTAKVVDDKLYDDDDLHLGNEAILRIGEFYRGIAATLMDRAKKQPYFHTWMPESPTPTPSHPST